MNRCTHWTWDVDIDGCYLVDSIEALEYGEDKISGPKHCPWIEVYSQTKPSRFAKDNCEVENCNIRIDNENFINLDQLPIDASNGYKFKIVWNNGISHENDGPFDNDYELHWEQAVHPLAIRNLNANPKNAHLIPSYSKPTMFSGLSLSRRIDTLLDGNAPHDWSWYAIGFTKYHNVTSGFGNRAYLYNTMRDGKKVTQRTQLFFQP